MYQFSRALFLETRQYVAGSNDAQRVNAQRRVLTSCENMVERMSQDPGYLPDPSRTLFLEIRSYFSINDQERIFAIVKRYLTAAQERMQEEADRRAQEEAGQCAAFTRKGTPCKRKPLPGKQLCPSHSHLESIVAS